MPQWEACKVCGGDHWTKDHPGPPAAAQASVPSPSTRAQRPVVTIHLPLEMGAVGAIMAAVAKAYPDAVVASGSAEVTDHDGRTYSSPMGAASILLAKADW